MVWSAVTIEKNELLSWSSVNFVVKLYSFGSLRNDPHYKCKV